MNTISSDNKKAIINKFNSLFIESSENDAILHEAYMLMAGYLSEIERIQEREGLTRKYLANKIDISASYLTQVFRGDKPLNFYTLAKIQRVLNIKFDVRAFHVNQYSEFSYMPVISINNRNNDKNYPKAGKSKTLENSMSFIPGAYFPNLNSEKTA